MSRGDSIIKVLKPVIPNGGSVRGEATTKRKTWKTFGGKVGSSWGGSGNGKFWKRKYNKSNRKAFKSEIRTGRLKYRGLSRNRSTVSWKNT